MAENRLARETSTYLRSAARQPVDWYPWGEEAFRRAKELDRPILLDIGASWCHWCHVIDRESYEDPELAKIINENFVPIKVDRDERPDVDARYQQAVSVLAGTGGWPLTVFLTPEGKAFYGGTYFPPKDAYGRPSFRRVLLAVSEHYRTNRGDALRDAEALHQALGESPETAVGVVPINEAFLKDAVHDLRRQFDPVNGGFGSAPKFPHPGTMEFLLARFHRTREEGFKNLVVRTLMGMALGGVRDHVGGGFHRYSTDAQWVVPHFEKMLYDNAGLLLNYVHGWQVAGIPLFRETAEGILSWVAEVLSDPGEGGYFASQDADVGPDDDGDYFTWTLEELRDALPPEESRIFAIAFDVGERGEMRHNPRKNVLFVGKDPAAIARELAIPVDRVQELLTRSLRRLKAARDRRPAPAVDRTIYASWNGMMVVAALEAAMALGRDDAKAFALRTLDRILRDLWTSDRGMYHGLADGQRKVLGLLEDHVFVVDALVAAYMATAEERYLRRAEEILAFTLRHFWDEERYGFLDVSPDLRDADGVALREIRRRPMEDSPHPGANAVAALVLQRLHALTGNDEYRLRHDELMMAFAGEASRYGALLAGTYHLAAELWIHPPPEIVLVGSRDDPKLWDLHRAAMSVYAPGKAVLVVERDEAYVPEPVRAMQRTREARGGAVAFLCRGRTCSEPTSDPQRVRSLLEAGIREV